MQTFCHNTSIWPLVQSSVHYTLLAVPVVIYCGVLSVYADDAGWLHDKHQYHSLQQHPVMSLWLVACYEDVMGNNCCKIPCCNIQKNLQILWTLNHQLQIVICQWSVPASPQPAAIPNCCRFLFSREMGNEPKRKSLFNFYTILLDTEKAI